MNLFRHNKQAYLSARAMLEETGKAAIIHPTGTGKSFIAFQLAEDYPDAKICWLSPSEYIFKTQIENLAASGADMPENIFFFTYAKLMMIDDDAINEIRPDYIILDEFHRCGAEMWGKGVETLLKRFSSTPILGLSATNIRYLDNQRDMADELFDGNIASEMSLGEAIVRGILKAPKYIISVYAYQKDLEKYKSRISRAKSKAVRDAGKEYLDALRRALGKSEGLDIVFQKHMKPNGKYIVFCANAEHMTEMKTHIKEWFSKVDQNPKVYSVYTDNPTTSKEFSDFKTDKSEHLRLLFCIDMLNEGVHVDDITGVVLLRPTVSPIIYKQQIGRALCAGKSEEPIIFDVVNNLQNLYSIGTIEEEMNVAINYYRFGDKTAEIVNEQFQIFDEIGDCKALFESLNDSLTASWDMMYAEAKKYHVQHGNLEIPHRYKTVEDYSLGSWILTQRRVKSGEQYGKLSEERILKLNEIGMIWNNYRDFAWERNYAEARTFFEAYGHLNTNVNHITQTGFRLGVWICQLRSYRKSSIQQKFLTRERIALLDELHMIWNAPDYHWEQNFLDAMDYYRTHGDLDIPSKYISESGTNLGTWMRTLRNTKKRPNGYVELTVEQIKRLDSIGMIWETKFVRQWDAGFEQAKIFYEQNGNLDVATSYISPDGFKLGDWLANHRLDGGIKVTAERKQKLDGIGMIWKKADAWEVRYAIAKQYFEEHGHLNVCYQLVIDGIWLNKWLNEQKQVYWGKRSGKLLSQHQIMRLEAISFDWRTASESAWDIRYADAVKCFESENGMGISGASAALKRWFTVQRGAFRRGTLTEKQMNQLNAIHFNWKQKDNSEAHDALIHSRRMSERSMVQIVDGMNRA